MEEEVVTRQELGDICWYSHSDQECDFLSRIYRGLNVHMRDEDGRTPMSYVCTKEPLFALLKKGANINAQTNLGNTILHSSHYPNFYNILVDNGADIFIKNVAGEYTHKFDRLLKYILQKSIDRTILIAERLMARTWHPKRFQKWCEEICISME